MFRFSSLLLSLSLSLFSVLLVSAALLPQHAKYYSETRPQLTLWSGSHVHWRFKIAYLYYFAFLGELFWSDSSVRL